MYINCTHVILEINADGTNSCPCIIIMLCAVNQRRWRWIGHVIRINRNNFLHATLRLTEKGEEADHMTPGEERWKNK